MDSECGPFNWSFSTLQLLQETPENFSRTRSGFCLEGAESSALKTDQRDDLLNGESKRLPKSVENVKCNTFPGCPGGIV